MLSYAELTGQKNIDILLKLERMKVKTVKRSQVTTVSKIQGTAQTACWADFCRPGSSCSGDTSLFALACRSAAGRRQTCARWVPACSCWSPRAPGSRGSPLKQQCRRIKNKNIYYGKPSHTSHPLQMSVATLYLVKDVELPQGEVDFGTATREQLNELHLIWEHFGLLPDLQSRIIAAHQHLLRFNWTD